MGPGTNGESGTPDDVIKLIISLGNACHFSGGLRKASSKCTFLQPGRLLNTTVKSFARFKCLLRAQIASYTISEYEAYWL